MISAGCAALRKVKETQVVMATRCGVSQAIVCKWLAGDKKPGIENRRVLTALYKIPFDAWDTTAPQDPKRAA